MTHATATDPAIVEGKLVEQRDGMIVLALPGTDYRMHLLVDAPVKADPGDLISGRIEAQAMRVDQARSGGRFIEPVFGRPRRVQGRILAVNADNNTVTVRAACPVVLHLTHPRQSAANFTIGVLGMCDVKPGARFITP
jgi:hypothetical protein